MSWLKIEVYNYDRFIGSFYTDAYKREDISIEISKKYGNNWTKFNLGN